MNLYGFVGNDPVGSVDWLGLTNWTIENTWTENITSNPNGAVGIAGHVVPSFWQVEWEIEDVDNGCYYELKVTKAKGGVRGNIRHEYKEAHERAHAADYKKTWQELLDKGVNEYDGHTATCRAEVECYGELLELLRQASYIRGIIRGLEFHKTGRGNIPAEPDYVINNEAATLQQYWAKWNSYKQQIQTKKSICPQLCDSGLP